MASRAGRRTATESASSFSRGEASFHSFPRATRRKESMPSRRWTNPRATPASDVDGGRTAQVYGINWRAHALSSRPHPYRRRSLARRNPGVPDVRDDRRSRARIVAVHLEHRLCLRHDRVPVGERKLCRLRGGFDRQAVITGVHPGRGCASVPTSRSLQAPPLAEFVRNTANRAGSPTCWWQGRRRS